MTVVNMQITSSYYLPHLHFSGVNSNLSEWNVRLADIAMQTESPNCLKSGYLFIVSMDLNFCLATHPWYST